MGTLAKIQRWYDRDKQSIKKISRQTDLSRNTVRGFCASQRWLNPRPQRSPGFSQVAGRAGHYVYFAES